MPAQTYMVEIAKTGQAKCRGNPCQVSGEAETKIEKQSLRIGKVVPLPEHMGSGESKHWYHVECWPDAMHRMQKKTTRPLSLYDYVGYDTLDKNNQKRVEQAIEQYKTQEDEGYKPPSPQKKTKVKSEGSTEVKQAVPDRIAALRNDSTNKIAHIKLIGTSVLIEQGRDNQSGPLTGNTHNFDSVDAANEYFDNEYMNKLRNNYVEYQLPQAHTTSTTTDDTTEKPKKKAFNAFREPEPPPMLGEKEVPTGADNCLSGLAFVATGTLDSLTRPQVTELLQKYGGVLRTGVTGKTNYLLKGDHGEYSEKKVGEAKAKDIPIINENQLFELIRNNPQGGPPTSQKPKTTTTKRKKTVKQESDDDDEEEEEVMPKPSKKRAPKQ